MRRVFITLVALLAMQCSVAAATLTEVHYVMGTYFRISAEGSDEERLRTALRRCFATARALDARFSRYDRHSELSHLNASTDERTLPISSEMRAILEAAVRLRAATHGAFDVGAGALTHLWRTTSEWPSPTMIAGVRELAGNDAFTVSRSTLNRHRGVAIDLDGIAKGWALDRCVEQLRADGLRRAFLNFGESSLYALGTPSRAEAWRVSLRGLDGTSVLGTLGLRDQAVSVSAVFGHERLVGTTRVGHIVDPRTGQPLTSPALAVVVADRATDAEAYSKAFLIEGSTGGVIEGRSAVSGAVVVRPGRTQRVGRIDFTPARSGTSIAAAAEPLR